MKNFKNCPLCGWEVDVVYNNYISNDTNPVEIDCPYCGLHFEDYDKKAAKYKWNRRAPIKRKFLDIKDVMNLKQGDTLQLKEGYVIKKIKFLEVRSNEFWYESDFEDYGGWFYLDNLNQNLFLYRE